MSSIPDMNIPNILGGKNIAVTGGTTGIGRAMCIALAKAGANLCILYLPVPEEENNAKTLGQEVAEIHGHNKGFVSMAGDVSQQQTAIDLVAKCVETFGEINVLFANAGICKHSDFLDTPAEFYHQHMKVNIDGVYFMVQEAGRQMKKQGKGGSIICTGSIRSLLGGGHLVPYTITKGAVLSCVQSAAAALGPFNIRVNCLMPGAVETAITKMNLNDDDRKMITSKIPMARMGVPEDFGGPAVFLASDLSRFLNGSEMLVDGGQYINLE